MVSEHECEPFPLGSGVEFETIGGGTITMIGRADHLRKTGVTSNGWAFYDDLYLNVHNDFSLNISDRQTAGMLRHITGDVIIQFHLTSRVPNGTADIEVRGLAPEEWYRLEFNTVLAKTDGGRAHGQASVNGELVFYGVHIPNE